MDKLKKPKKSCKNTRCKVSSARKAVLQESTYILKDESGVFLLVGKSMNVAKTIAQHGIIEIERNVPNTKYRKQGILNKESSINSKDRFIHVKPAINEREAFQFKSESANMWKEKYKPRTVAEVWVDLPGEIEVVKK